MPTKKKFLWCWYILNFFLHFLFFFFLKNILNKFFLWTKFPHSFNIQSKIYFGDQLKQMCLRILTKASWWGEGGVLLMPMVATANTHRGTLGQGCLWTCTRMAGPTHCHTVGLGQLLISGLCMVNESKLLQLYTYFQYLAIECWWWITISYTLTE